LSRSELAGTLYDLVTGDEDARVCKDIPDAARLDCSASREPWARRACMK